MTSDDASSTGEKRTGRQPGGPPHDRKGSAAQTLKRTLTEFRGDNLTDKAAALTYYAVLSIFPALVAMIAVVGLVGNPQTITTELTKLASSLGPASAAQTFKGPIASLARGNSATGILLIIGVASALWTASGYVGTFMRAFYTIYEVEEGRSFLKLRPLQMLVTLILVMLLALALVALVVTGPIASGVGSAIGASTVGGNRLGHRQMAAAAYRRDLHDRRALLRLAERPAPRPQVDHPWQPAGRRGVAVGLGWLRALRRQLRLLQQDLRRAGRRRRHARLAVDHQRRHTPRRRSQRRA